MSELGRDVSTHGREGDSAAIVRKIWAGRRPKKDVSKSQCERKIEDLKTI